MAKRNIAAHFHGLSFFRQLQFWLDCVPHFQFYVMLECQHYHIFRESLEEIMTVPDFIFPSTSQLLITPLIRAHPTISSYDNSLSQARPRPIQHRQGVALVQPQPNVMVSTV
jgi:hypothetical protein